MLTDCVCDVDACGCEGAGDGRDVDCSAARGPSVQSGRCQLQTLNLSSESQTGSLPHVLMGLRLSNCMLSVGTLCVHWSAAASR